MVGEPLDLSVASDAEVRALIDRAASGDARAAATLVDGVAPLLRARVARALSRRWRQSAGRALVQDTEDMVQETLAGMFANGGRTLRSWDPARGLGFLNFLGLVAERRVSMRMRTRRRNPWTEEPTPVDRLMHLGGMTDDLALQIESRDLLRQIIGRLHQRLGPRGFRYFQWLVLENRSVRTVASETGASEQAIYAWRSRLIRSAREIRAELRDRAEGADRQHHSARRSGRRARLRQPAHPARAQRSPPPALTSLPSRAPSASEM